jgi:hypothetical protein
MSDLMKYNSLIGKKISASGWQRDNGGSIRGVIISIEKGFYGTIKVVASKDYEWCMNDFTFSEGEMDILLTSGVLPKANRMLNSGTDAEIN